ncbi:MAG: Gfo/Idh/MocA family oxidoreductase [Saprospiraceae bacterium]|nr:Gfo/Idh/MocA family oxidoreductase [Saprospiraceae bacterium]
MKKSTTSHDRRNFLKQSSTVAAGIALGTNLSSPLINPVLGANDQIRMGFIGVGNRGTQLLNRFKANPDVKVVALCDVYEPYRTRDMSQISERVKASGRIPKLAPLDGNIRQYNDFRVLLEQKDIDAVCIATPDHWHAIQTIAAMDAGKDVYVEKPLTITLKEGRAMVNAQNKSGRIAAVGLNRRGSRMYQDLAVAVQNDLIGKVSFARACRISNMYPNGIGKLGPEGAPSNLDWDMWLGPRAFRPFQYNIAPYYFRWWSDYSSQMGNWGVHYMDVIRWMLGETAPSAITAHGTNQMVDDDRDIPDTMQVTFEFDSGTIISFGIYEAGSGGGIMGGEVELNGTKGTLIANQKSYQIKPSSPGQFQTWKKLMEPKNPALTAAEDSTANLIRNFLDCVKSRNEPLCTLEDGHRSTSFAHLANIALKVGQRIEWDAEKEVITNVKEANELLHYPYRSPWKLS